MGAHHTLRMLTNADVCCCVAGTQAMDAHYSSRMLALEESWRALIKVLKFTCFTSTNVQILTLARAHQVPA
jgi:hypothetical protein